MHDPKARDILNSAAFSLGVLANSPEAKRAVEMRGRHHSGEKR